uniref:Uncharacterized protein n=1 Tax=Glossina austeni TaxID=7395 RepID=A0A1A9VMP9_GLOAU
MRLCSLPTIHLLPHPALHMQFVNKLFISPPSYHLCKCTRHGSKKVKEVDAYLKKLTASSIILRRCICVFNVKSYPPTILIVGGHYNRRGNGVCEENASLSSCGRHSNITLFLVIWLTLCKRLINEIILQKMQEITWSHARNARRVYNGNGIRAGVCFFKLNLILLSSTASHCQIDYCTAMLGLLSRDLNKSCQDRDAFKSLRHFLILLCFGGKATKASSDKGMKRNEAMKTYNVPTVNKVYLGYHITTTTTTIIATTIAIAFYGCTY